MRLITVRVEKAPETHATISVAPWELPLLQLIHRQVVEVGEVHVERDFPEPASEYQRLETRYGFDVESSETPYVTQIYGHGPARLAQAIEMEVAAEQKAKAAKPKAKGAVPIDS